MTAGIRKTGASARPTRPSIAPASPVPPGPNIAMDIVSARSNRTCSTMPNPETDQAPTASIANSNPA